MVHRMSNPLLPRVLVTGAAGFLGRAILQELLDEGFTVRAFDVVAAQESAGVEVVQGDVTDPEDVARACDGCGMMVIAHMAPNRPGVYEGPSLPFDINVKGVALLFAEAVRREMRRVVLISSITVVDGHRASGRLLGTELPAKPLTLYGLTKSLQEEIAVYHHRQSGLSVAMLRPAYVTDADTLTDKYGKNRPSVNWQFVDRRDVAGATLAALKAPGLTCGRYYVDGHPKASEILDVAPTRADLGWTPRHDFGAWPEDAPV